VTRSLLPQEHGAYGQIAYPLLTGLAVAGASTAGLLLAIAVVAGFLAHEPAAIVIGLRGSRAQRELGQSAARWLYRWLALVSAAGVAAASFIHPTARWSLAVPAIPAALLAVAMVAGREKSWYGETAAAMAFAGVAVPLTLAAGASIDVAWIVAIAFALLFIATTLAVRVVILRVRGGGDPAAAAATRRATLVISVGSLAVIAAVTTAGWLAPALLIAAAPGLCTAAWVAARPPASNRLRPLGWSLVAVSTLTAVILVSTV
jgi:YwiC-like protein